MFRREEERLPTVEDLQQLAVLHQQQLAVLHQQQQHALHQQQQHHQGRGTEELPPHPAVPAVAAAAGGGGHQ